MEERKLTCIGCPMGCQLQVIIKDGIVEKVTGNTCKRGADYGKKEVTDPTRIVTSTVRVQGGTLLGLVFALIRVRKHWWDDIPKSSVMDCVLAESYVK